MAGGGGREEEQSQILFCIKVNYFNRIQKGSQEFSQPFRRLYTVISFCSSMLLWKGGWDCCIIMRGVIKEHVCGTPLVPSLIMAAAGAAGVALLRHSRAVVGSPLCFATDERESYFRVGMEEGTVSKEIVAFPPFTSIKVSASAAFTLVFNTLFMYSPPRKALF